MNKLVARFAVLIVAALGLCSCGSASDAAPPPPSSTSTTQSNGDWYAENSGPLEAVQTDLADIGAAAGDGDTSALSDACSQLSDDVADAQDSPPVPDPAVDGPLQDALDDFADGAAMCASGADNLDTAAMNAAADSFSSGAENIKTATEALGR